MKSPVLLALGLALAVGIVSGCSGSGSDNPALVSNGPPAAAAEDDRHIPQSDALTDAEVGLVSQANAEPVPAQLPDL
jgi:hypothetical protein